MTATHKFPRPTVSFDLTTSEPHHVVSLRRGGRLELHELPTSHRDFRRRKPSVHRDREFEAHVALYGWRIPLHIVIMKELAKGGTPVDLRADFECVETSGWHRDLLISLYGERHPVSIYVQRSTERITRRSNLKGTVRGPSFSNLKWPTVPLEGWGVLREAVFTYSPIKREGVRQMLFGAAMRVDCKDHAGSARSRLMRISNDVAVPFLPYHLVNPQRGLRRMEGSIPPAIANVPVRAFRFLSIRESVGPGWGQRNGAGTNEQHCPYQE